MRECTVAKNKKNCGCSYMACGNRGICCECLQSHLKKGQLPGCCFPPDVEKTYDRSIETFVKTFQEKGPWW
ncbi:MAG TPA: DUF6485 family protein [Candidatus Brocadiia bacterium]|nr:DUF6485 family protein [Candidatus Brocadiia bacterium]